MVVQDPVNLDNLEGMQAKREADAAYEDLKGKPLDTEGAANAMGGIGKIDPKEGMEIAAKNLSEEAHEESSEPELDFSVFDNTNGVTETGSEEKEIGQIGVSGEYVPLFSKFTAEGKLTPEDFKTLQEANVTSENFETAIQGVDISNDKKTALIDSLKHLNSSERIEKVQGELVEEYPEVFKGFQLDSKGPETQWVSDFHEEAFAIISQHYMGGETKTSDERNADFSLAISMAAEDLGGKAKIAINASNIETFNTNLRVAQNTTLGDKERYEALVNIAELNSHVEGVKGKGKLAEQMRIAGKRKLAEAGKLEEFQKHLDDLQVARDNKNQEQITEIREKLEAISKDAGLSSGEATTLIGGEMDMVTENASEQVTETP